jgi:hypothetical protein
MRHRLFLRQAQGERPRQFAGDLVLVDMCGFDRVGNNPDTGQKIESAR